MFGPYEIDSKAIMPVLQGLQSAKISPTSGILSAPLFDPNVPHEEGTIFPLHEGEDLGEGKKPYVRQTNHEKTNGTIEST